MESMKRSTLVTYQSWCRNTLNYAADGRMEWSTFTDYAKENESSIKSPGEVADFQRPVETLSSGLLKTQWREVCGEWEVQAVAAERSKVN